MPLEVVCRCTHVVKRERWAHGYLMAQWIGPPDTCTCTETRWVDAPNEPAVGVVRGALERLSPICQEVYGYARGEQHEHTD